VAAPIGHDADRSAATAGANETAMLGDRRGRRAIFNAGGGEGYEVRMKANSVGARHPEPVAPMDAASIRKLFNS